MLTLTVKINFSDRLSKDIKSRTFVDYLLRI